MYAENINYNEDERSSAANYVAQNRSNQHQAKTLEDNRPSVFTLSTLQRSADSEIIQRGGSEGKSEFDSNFEKFTENWIKDGKIIDFSMFHETNILKAIAALNRMLNKLSGFAQSQEQKAQIRELQSQLVALPSYKEASFLQSNALNLYNEAKKILSNSNTIRGKNTYEWLQKNDEKISFFAPTLQGNNDGGTGIVGGEKLESEIEFENIRSKVKVERPVEVNAGENSGIIEIFLKLKMDAELIARIFIHEVQHAMDKNRVMLTDPNISNEQYKTQVFFQKAMTELRAFVYAMDDLGKGRKAADNKDIATDDWEKIGVYEIGTGDNAKSIQTTEVLYNVFNKSILPAYEHIQEEWISNNIVPSTGKPFRDSIADYLSTSNNEALGADSEAELLNNQTRDGANPFNSIRLEEFYNVTKKKKEKTPLEEAVNGIDAANLTLDEKKFLSKSPWWNEYLAKEIEKPEEFFKELNEKIEEEEFVENSIKELEEEEKAKKEEEEEEAFVNNLEEEEEEEEFEEEEDEEGLPDSSEPNPGRRIVTRNDSLMELMGRIDNLLPDQAPQVTYQSLASEVEKLKNDIIRTKAEAGGTLQEHRRNHFENEYDKLNKRLREIKNQNIRLSYEERSRTRTALTIKIEEVDSLLANFYQIFLATLRTPGSARTLAWLGAEGRAGHR